MSGSRARGGAMARSALRELKHHPARYFATILAIAVSVGFMAAASIVTATESHAITRQLIAPYSRADLLVEPLEVPGEISISAITEAITGLDQVAAAVPVTNMTVLLSRGDRVEIVEVTALLPPLLMWTGLRQGSWPQGAEIALNSRLARALGVGLGDTVTCFETELTVVGITTDRPSRLGTNPAVVDEQWVLAEYGESHPAYTTWAVALDSGSTIQDASPAVTTALTSLGLVARVQTQSEYAHRAGLEMTNGIDAFKYLLWVFAGIAMVVGLITIANTFTILLAQRRRQIGLIRSIGASARQVRRSIWVEAVILGCVGGLAGIGLACGLAALLGVYTGSIHYSIVVPWRDAGVAVGLGLLITVVACAVPARRATRMAPLDALQPPVADLGATKVPVVRAVICTVFFLVGLAMSVYAIGAAGNALIIAVAGAMILAVGVLFGARLFVPYLLKAARWLVRRWGPPASAAAKNVLRDPARASATATALMLAVGLIITLQVGAASMRATMVAKIESSYPIDLYVQAYYDPQGRLDLPEDLITQLSRVSGIDRVATIPCRQLVSPDDPDLFWDRLVCDYLPELAGFAPGLPDSVADDQILVPADAWYPKVGDQVVYPGIRLTATASTAAMDSIAFVSGSTYAKLTGESFDRAVVFLAVPDRSMVASVLQAVQELVGNDNPAGSVGGSVLEKSSVEQVLSIVVGVVTALLAVAVFIALVGVSNTLTLSVIERTRENAILRVLGFQRYQLRIMLLVEALLLTVVGAVVGVVAGVFFGWLGATAMVSQFQAQEVDLSIRFALDWPQTLILVAVLLVAAALASILPGRRSALASPVAALAEI